MLSSPSIVFKNPDKELKNVVFPLPDLPHTAFIPFWNSDCVCNLKESKWVVKLKFKELYDLAVYDIIYNLKYI